MDYFKNFLTKVSKKDLKVGVIGLGYTGLPLAMKFCSIGLSVIGFDIDSKKIELLTAGKSYLKSIPNNSLNTVKHLFQPTENFGLAAECDVLILCLPTPLTKENHPDLSFIQESVKSILPYIKKGQLISLESTSYPGTTEDLIVAPLNNIGFEIGKDLFVVYSPERIDPGREDFDIQTTPKICAGVTENCLLLGKDFYELVVDKIHTVSSTKTAELTKLLENIQRSVNIALINEMKIIADQMGIDIHEAVKAASTKPFGFTSYEPGPGVGGHCIPIDPYYLSWKAREMGVQSSFIDLAGAINSQMPGFVVGKVLESLNERKIPMSSARVLVLGVAYKRDVDDVRGSPALEIIKLLREKKVCVHFSDPNISQIPHDFGSDFWNESIPLTAEQIQEYDATVIVTDHNDFDFDLIFKSSKLIVDSRGRFPNHPKVIKA